MSDSSVVQSTLTDSKGNYGFSGIAKGNYIQKVFMVGYANLNLMLNIDESPKTLAVVTLRSSSVNLNEVSVSTLKKLVEFKNGNVTVNIEDSPLATGNSAWDLLIRLPGVSIDENNTINIQGRSGVKILIDDRIQQMSNSQLINLLKSMNASGISKIEVLKNPPLRYDAAGTAGLINIRTKRIKLVGFSGLANYNYSQGYYGNQYADLSLNYRGKKLVFYSTLTYDKQVLYHNHRLYKTIRTAKDTTVLDNRMDNYDGGVYYAGRVGLDWFLNSKNTVGVKATMEGGIGFERDNGTNYISNNDLGFERLIFKTFINNPWNYSNINFNAEHLFDTIGSKLVFSSDYSPNFDIYSGTFDNWFTDNSGNYVLQPYYYINTNLVKSNIVSSKLDFTKKTLSGLAVEAGIKGTMADLSSRYDLHNKNNSTGEFILDTSFTNEFSYHEELTAAYFNLVKEWKGFVFQAGLRGENTHIIVENSSRTLRYTRDYFNLFPAGSIEYNKNENHNFQLSYNRRIDRPDYGQFNPFRYRNSLFQSSKGNPALLPEYSNSLELTHTFKGALTNSFSYSTINHFLLDLTLQNDSTKETTAYVDNLSKADRFAYSIFLNAPVRKWWTLTLNGTASYLNVEGLLLGQSYKSNGYFYMAALTNEFLIKKTKIEINGRYIGPRFNGVWMNGPRWGIYMAIKKSYFNERLNVVMGINDVFFSMIGSNKIKIQNQDWFIKATNDSRRFKISLTYNFGKVKVEERNVSSNEEEKGRLGK